MLKTESFREEHDFGERTIEMIPIDPKTKEDKVYTHCFVWLIGTLQTYSYYLKLIKKKQFGAPQGCKVIIMYPSFKVFSHPVR